MSGPSRAKASDGNDVTEAESGFDEYYAPTDSYSGDSSAMSSFHVPPEDDTKSYILYESQPSYNSIPCY